MLNARDRLQDSFALTARLLQEQLLWLGSLWLIDAMVTIGLENRLAQMTPTQADGRWVYQVGAGIWGLFEAIALFLILSYGAAKVAGLKPPAFKTEPFREPYLGSFLAEYLRLLAQVLLWALLLLLPALYRYCQLIFVPYIALFAKPYRDGKADALTLSKNLSRERLGLIIGIFLLTSVLTVGCEFAPQLMPALHNIPGRMGFLFLSLLISTWTYSFIFGLFKEAMEEQTWT